ncbi:MAG: 23S rRNA (adenine(2503)-C(2))-methyltransferase RlmN, partial [Acidimicrobiales bacterium]
MGRYDLTLDEVAALLPGQPAYRSRQVWEGLRRGDDPAELIVLPRALRERLAAEPALAPSLRLDAEVASEGGHTVKWRWALDDDRVVETVLMHYPDRTTVCVSSQAGCAMGCGFCATGQAGFERNLTTGEIVEQVVRAGAEARRGGRRLSNVVFMGMGEPLANLDRVWPAVERLHRDQGLSARHLTLSTIGIVPGIRRLAAESLPVNLAVSLHAADDALRDELIPINRRYPIAMLMDACRVWVASKGRRLSFEWALIDGVNDRPSDAAALAQLARSLHAHVNLIPLNPTPGWPTRGTPPAGVRAFGRLLGSLGANATVRRNR